MIEYIFKRVRELSIELFSIDYDQYLLLKCDRKLICIFLNRNGEVLQSSESIPGCIRDYFQDKGFDAKSGYAISESVPGVASNYNADLIFFSEELLSMSESAIDKIILHELCHFVIESKEKYLIKETESASKLGNWLYSCTDKDWENITRHTLEFCLLLAKAAEKASQKKIFTETPEEILKSAMSFDAVFD